MNILFFAIPYFAKALPFNVKEIKVALSLQSFNFPQISSEFSEDTHKTAVPYK